MSLIRCCTWCFALAFALPAHSQGTFFFRNYDASHGIDAPVFDSTGVPLSGTNYLATLYGGLTPESLEQASGSLGLPLTCPFTYAPSGQTGYFSSGNDTARFSQVAVAGILVWLQVKVWDVRLGDSYEEVAAKGIEGYGASELFQDLSGGNSGGVPFPPGRLYHLQSFSLVPEPSSFALLGLGVLALVLNFGKRINMKENSWLIV